MRTRITGPIVDLARHKTGKRMDGRTRRTHSRANQTRRTGVHAEHAGDLAGTLMWMTFTAPASWFVKVSPDLNGFA